MYVIVLQDRSNAQVSCAGLFIGSHLGFEYPGIWLHVDMAAPAHQVCHKNILALTWRELLSIFLQNKKSLKCFSISLENY